MAISAKFEADFSQFRDEVAKATGSLKSIEEGAKTLGPSIMASLASTEVRRFATDVASAAKDFVGAYAEEEAATKKLMVALQNQGSFTPELGKQYTDLAAHFQNTTVFSDDLIISMEALLVQVGNVAPAQMQKALEASANLSAGLGIDLHTATLAVAKGFEGGTTALVKMVPALKDVIKDGASMDEVLVTLQKNFGGQAQAQIETTAGKMAMFANKADDAKESVGKLLTDGLQPLLDAFNSLPDSVKTTIISVVAIGAALAPLAVTVAALIPIVSGVAAAFGTAGLVAALTAVLPFIGAAGLIAVGIIAWYQVFKNLDVFIWAAKAGWEALTGAFKSAADSIIGYAKALYEGVKTWLVDKFQAIVGWVQDKINAIIAAFQAMLEAVTLHSSVPDMVKGIAAEFQKLDKVMVQPTIKATQQVTTQFAGMEGATLNAGVGVSSAGGITVPITINGSVLGSPSEIARVVSEALVNQLRSLGVRLPAGT